VTDNGPGKLGGSRATVRKRAQRKRKAARESVKSVRNQNQEATSTKPVLNRSEKDVENRIGNMAYELVMLSVQLRKSLNNYGSHVDSIVDDLKRAEGVIRGTLKENEARDRKE